MSHAHVRRIAQTIDAAAVAAAAVAAAVAAADALRRQAANGSEWRRVKNIRVNVANTVTGRGTL